MGESLGEIAGPRLLRLGHSLRNRDWTGILIEFAVVTLGVLLAFEIDQWGQDRREGAEEHQFLERMWRESANISREGAAAAEAHQNEAQGLLDIYRARQNPPELQRLSSENLGAGCRILVLPSQGLSDTTTQELISSGRLNIVSDPKVREELRELAASQEQAAGELNYMREFAPRLSEHIDRYTTAFIDVAGRNGCLIRWTEVFKDPLAVQALTRARRIHVLMGEVRSDVRDRAGKIHHDLSCVLHKAECP